MIPIQIGSGITILNSRSNFSLREEAVHTKVKVTRLFGNKFQNCIDPKKEREKVFFEKQICTPLRSPVSLHSTRPLLPFKRGLRLNPNPTST